MQKMQCNEALCHNQQHIVALVDASNYTYFCFCVYYFKFTFSEAPTGIDPTIEQHKLATANIKANSVKNKQVQENGEETHSSNKRGDYLICTSIYVSQFTVETYCFADGRCLFK